MVSCKLMGRLGNQLFQIAAVFGYAMKHNVDFSIPETTLNPKIWKSYFDNLYKPLPAGQGMYAIYKEPSHAYAEIPLYINVMLDGYFQSYKYFDFCLDKLRELFGFDWQLDKKTVAVHVRRGDYLLYPDKHPVVTPEYLYQAISFFIMHGYKHFVFYSDDIGWCMELEKPWVRGIDYGYSENKSEEEDLMMMSCAEHQIISNSSYSYWAAMLNRNKDKIIIAPSVESWFGPANKHLDTSTMCPPEWKRLNF